MGWTKKGNNLQAGKRLQISSESKTDQSEQGQVEKSQSIAKGKTVN